MDLSDFFESMDMTEIASGFQFTEGPVWHPKGHLFFSDIPASIIYRLDPGKLGVPWRTPSGQSNGLTFDRQGRLVACEHATRRVSRTEETGAVVPLATHYEGKRLNSPNDVVVRSDGSIYFTDPPFGVSAEGKDLPFSGLYRIRPDGELELLIDDFDRPNGLAFSPDERILYVNDSTHRHIRAFDVSSDGGLVGDRLFADMEADADGSPDGMKVDVEGNVYCTGPGGLWVFLPSGEKVGVVTGPELPANLAFGGEDLKTLYLTARNSLYTLRTRKPGLPVF